MFANISFIKRKRFLYSRNSQNIPTGFNPIKSNININRICNELLKYAFRGDYNVNPFLEL